MTFDPDESQYSVISEWHSTHDAESQSFTPGEGKKAVEHSKTHTTRCSNDLSGSDIRNILEMVAYAILYENDLPVSLKCL